MKRRRIEENGVDKRKRPLKAPKLEAVRYSFDFERAVNNGSYLPNLIPKEVWWVHILPWLEKDFPRLRLVCRAFMFIVSPIWKNRAGTMLLTDRKFSGIWRAWLDCPRWPFRLHTLVIETTKYIRPSTINGEKKEGMSLLISRLAPLDPMFVIFDKSFHPSHLSEAQDCLKHFPHLQGLWVHECTFTESLLKSLPPTLHTLFFFCGSTGNFWNTERFKENIEDLPVTIRKLGLLYSYPSHLSSDRDYIGGISFWGSPPPLKTGLQSLAISCCEGITNEDISVLPTTLTTLCLRRCFRITGDVFNFMPASISQFHFQCYTSFDPVQTFANLRVLHLGYPYRHRDYKSVIDHFRALSMLIKESFPNLVELVFLPDNNSLPDEILCYQRKIGMEVSLGNVLPFIQNHEKGFIEYLEETGLSPSPRFFCIV